MNTDNVMLNLKIITEVKKNDKLTFANEILAIDRDTVFQAIRRWYSGETRTKSLDYINSIYESAFALADQLMEELSSGDAKNSAYDLLQRLLIEMNCSMKGIVNLKETYGDDIATLSKIALLEDKIRIKIDKINTSFRALFV